MLAVVVLGTIVAWARCSYNPPAAAPDLASFFLGCFNGAVTDPPVDAKVTVIFEEPTGGLVLSGCLQTIEGDRQELASLSGRVADGPVENAAVTAMPAGGGPPFELAIVREPAGSVDAAQVDVTDAGGAPFDEAADLLRCSPATTCAALAAAMRRQIQQPVLELP